MHYYDERGARGDEVLDVGADEGGVCGEVCDGRAGARGRGKGGDVQGVAGGGEGCGEVGVGGGRVPAARDEDEGWFFGGHCEGGWMNGERKWCVC